MKKFWAKAIFFFCKIIPSRRIQLLAGAWILSLGVFSCQQKKVGTNERDKDSTNKADTVIQSCYAPVVNDSSETKPQKSTQTQKPKPRQVKQDTSTKKVNPDPKIMCYAPMPPQKKDKE